MTRLASAVLTAVALFTGVSLSAQNVGWAVTYGGQPPSTSSQVDVLANGATYQTPQGGTGSVNVRPGTVTGARWVRVGNNCVILVGEEVIGTILDYFNPRARIDHDNDWTTPTVPGGYTTDANGGAAGYWVRG